MRIEGPGHKISLVITENRVLTGAPSRTPDELPLDSSGIRDVSQLIGAALALNRAPYSGVCALVS